MSESKSLWKDAFERMIRQRIVLVSMAMIVLYLLLGLFVGLGLIGGSWDQAIGEGYQSPSFDSIRHWMGTDIFGRSVLLKMIHGIQTALIVGGIASLISVFIGLTLGAIAGYFGRWVDDLVVWFYTTFSSIPAIMFLIAITFVLEKGLVTVCIAIGLTSWVGLCRVIRGEVLKHKNREYVQAARAIGASHRSRIFRHILPNIFHQVIINFSLMFQSAIKSEVILSYLGLGVQGRPSWGLMIDDSKLVLGRGIWWELTAATLAMFLLVLALNIFSDALRDALDPKLKSS
ncbi:MAG: peptide ABC transporter permease [Phyllobacteriaceae bacterium]|nr:peptide ABC transporter permease [Phyllobacteriaceae bacterium]